MLNAKVMKKAVGIRPKTRPVTDWSFGLRHSLVISAWPLVIAPWLEGVEKRFGFFEKSGLFFEKILHFNVKFRKFFGFIFSKKTAKPMATA
jgi:hypothetical protein